LATTKITTPETLRDLDLGLHHLEGVTTTPDVTVSVVIDLGLHHLESVTTTPDVTVARNTNVEDAGRRLLQALM